MGIQVIWKFAALQSPSWFKLLPAVKVTIVSFRFISFQNVSLESRTWIIWQSYLKFWSTAIEEGLNGRSLPAPQAECPLPPSGNSFQRMATCCPVPRPNHAPQPSPDLKAGSPRHILGDTACQAIRSDLLPGKGWVFDPALAPIAPALSLRLYMRGKTPGMQNHQRRLLLYGTLGSHAVRWDFALP